MGDTAPHLMICTCEKTMPLDAPAIGRACTGRITQADQLCGLEIDRFKAALAEGGPITVACTQEAPLFREVAEDLVSSSALTFVNIREAAGWSKDAAAAGPKAAALIAAAAEEFAAHRAGDARKQRRRLDLWPRRCGDRGRSPTCRPSRRHGASDQARRRDPSPLKRVSGPEGQRAQWARASRPV